MLILSADIPPTKLFSCGLVLYVCLFCIVSWHDALTVAVFLSTCNSLMVSKVDVKYLEFNYDRRWNLNFVINVNLYLKLKKCCPNTLHSFILTVIKSHSAVRLHLWNFSLIRKVIRALKLIISWQILYDVLIILKSKQILLKAWISNIAHNVFHGSRVYFELKLSTLDLGITISW